MAIAKASRPTSYVVHVPEAVDVKRSDAKEGSRKRSLRVDMVFRWPRERLGAASIFSRTPSRILLLIIDKEPDVIERVLSAA